MRLWHVSLIPYLPKKQLLGQWRECCAIAKSIEVNGTPNHMLVNQIMDYPKEDFNTYAEAVADEIEKRGYKVDRHRFYAHRKSDSIRDINKIFIPWHTNIYLRICMANLLEKYRCHGISTTEWVDLLNGYKCLAKKEYEV